MTRWFATRPSTWPWASCLTAHGMCWASGSSRPKGAKFWLKVFNELRSRGVGDILIAVVDGLKGLSEAIETAFPSTTVQTCMMNQFAVLYGDRFTNPKN
jgi:hypothetical protein